MKQASFQPVSTREVSKLKRNWQKTGLEQLPNLFIAFDKKSDESKRVVAFQLSKKAYGHIAKLAGPIKSIEIILGARRYKTAELEDIPDEPFFVPLLKVIVSDSKSNIYPLSWIPNPDFMDASQDVNSRVEAIPGAGAYLFILSWLELKFRELHQPFIGIANGKNQRVNKYIFAKAESNAILSDMKESGKTAFNLYMGNGIRVSSHPFPFRPVIEIGKNTKNFIAGGSSFYDFCNPCPPYCGEE